MHTLASLPTRPAPQQPSRATAPRHQQYLDQLFGAAASHGSCPALLLAPMEGLMDASTRRALHDCLAAHCLGSFDEACTEFIRVPAESENPRATARGITAAYDAAELGCVPLAAQLMGSSAHMLAATALHLVHHKGAPRIDLNAGCPANIVTGGGAGSSLLKDPRLLHECVAALVAAVGAVVPVTVKMRSGFLDTGLFRENLLAVQDAGASFVTIHPRTKQQSYNGAADWSLIAAAKDLLHVPVVGNGDVICVSSAVSLVRQTGCDGVMVGRGVLQDPLLLHRIRTHFRHQQQSGAAQQQQQQQQQPELQEQPRTDVGVREADVVSDFVRRYATAGFDRHARTDTRNQAARIGRLKKIMKYLFAGQPSLRAACSDLLRVQPGAVSADMLLERMLEQVQAHWEQGGPRERFLVSHVTMSGSSKAEQTWQPAGGANAAPMT